MRFNLPQQIELSKELYMNFIFLGPPGAGNGTLAGQVAEEYGIPHIYTGDIFRANIKNKTPLGVKVKAVIDAGGLVSDEDTVALVEDRLKQDDCKKGPLFHRLNLIFLPDLPDPLPAGPSVL